MLKFSERKELRVYITENVSSISFSVGKRCFILESNILFFVNEFFQKYISLTWEQIEKRLIEFYPVLFVNFKQRKVFNFVI